MLLPVALAGHVECFVVPNSYGVAVVLPRYGYDYVDTNGQKEPVFGAVQAQRCKAGFPPGC